MSKLIAKCGIDCGACPWGPYPRENMSKENFEQYRKKAKMILGYMPIITPCATCQTPDAEIPKKTKLPNRKCLIRQCIDKSGIENCAYCSRFPCDTLKATSSLWTRKNIEKKLCRAISEEEYQKFVKPFEGVSRLNSIRDSLEPKQIINPAKAVKSKSSFIDFPANISLPKKQIAQFRAVHDLLHNLEKSALGLKDTDTFAQNHKLEDLKAHVFRFLWILGNHGTFEKGNEGRLTVDSETYEANRGNQKRLAIWSFVKDTVFEILSGFGVYCERVPLKGIKEESLVTPTGYMRSKGWVMAMCFETKIGGMAALKALHDYTQKLEKKNGKRAFKHFRNANMQNGVFG